MVKRVKYILHVLASIDKGLILTIHWHNRTENVQNRPRCHEQVQALFSQSSQQPTIDIGAASDVKSDIIELIDSTRKWSTKGMQRVLEERRFKVAKLRAKCSPVCPIDTNCCMARLLSQQDDFKNQPSILKTFIHSREHEHIFLPKFHCELNPIEKVFTSIHSKYWIQVRRKPLRMPRKRHSAYSGSESKTKKEFVY